MNKVAETAKFKVSDKKNPQAAELSINIGGKDYKSVLTPEVFSAIISDLVMRLYQESIGEQRQKILELTSIFEAVLAKQIPEKIKEMRAKLERIFDDYDSEIW